MGRRSSCASRLAAEALLAALALALPGMAGAETAIKGVVRDRITGAPVSGASVEARRGGETLGRAVSDAPDGRFLLTVEVGSRPEATNLKLLVSRDGYEPDDADLVVASGRTNPETVAVQLLRGAVAACKTGGGRPSWVVVGHFRPPLHGDLTELPGRVAEAVRWELTKIAETSSLAPERRPAVVSCDQIDDREYLAATARALRADALLIGSVKPMPHGPRFQLTMLLGDQHDLFRDAPTLVSKEIDLEEARASRLDAAASAAILQAVLTGYRKAGRFEDCVELGRRAGAELKPLPEAIARLRAECASLLDANGLRGGAH